MPPVKQADIGCGVGGLKVKESTVPALPRLESGMKQDGKGVGTVDQQ